MFSGRAAAAVENQNKGTPCADLQPEAVPVALHKLENDGIGREISRSR